MAITPDLDVVTVLDDPDGERVVSPTSIALGGPDRRRLYIGSLAADHVVTGPSPVAGRTSLAAPCSCRLGDRGAPGRLGPSRAGRRVCSSGSMVGAPRCGDSGAR